MCGLGGFVTETLRADLQSREKIANAMAKQLEHRGPDETVIEHRENATLVFTRLALTAPENGRQPFVSDDGKVMVMANGEVYNHRELERSFSHLRLKTRSDCEVLLHLYERDGVAFLDNVRGMVACVVIDLRRNSVLLARDQYGIKPLFHSTNSSTLVFGSEIKTLLSHPDTNISLDWETALEARSLMSLPALGDERLTSWYANVELVPAGVVREFRIGTPGWKDTILPRISYGYENLTSRNEFVDAFDQCIKESVQACTTADVGLGIFLSGGIDSVLVAALAKDKNLPTFSIMGSGTVASEDAKYAWEAARELDLPHHQVYFPSDHVPAADEWINLVQTMETPQTGPEQYFKYSMHQKARELYPDLKGMLLGAAADEYFGGYSKMLADGGDWREFIDELKGMQDIDNHHWTMDGIQPVKVPGSTEIELYNRFLQWKHTDVKQYNLWHEDRTAAAFGTEARVPYLDPKLTSLIQSVPARKRSEFLHDKSILREVAAHHVSAKFARRPKVPFYHGTGFQNVNVSFAKMLSANNYELIDFALQSDRAGDHLDGDALKTLAKRTEDAPSKHRIDKILRLVNLGILDQLQPTTVKYGSDTRAQLHITSSADEVFEDIVPLEFTADPSEKIMGSRLTIAPTSNLAVDLKGEEILLMADGEISYIIENRESPLFRTLEALYDCSDVDKICLSLGIDISQISDDIVKLVNEGFLVKE
ncbi:asparagine synthase (glutamine-hydrolyzing) [Glutamicibacter mishrai]|uniref:asparagine synthase (glutamine-hydrolyzing) n=1 Tax=Glutamicibacter mishrai TaxID=1775880 RepID=UPI0020CDDBC0|nr:asparagine synthase (glutamine-hydrolyzing) [Glutamicibacter mishrai]UTT39883.1 asparagine synthase (glutamine-hydrolyzing) [Glutamicibacter mishrai]